MAKSKEAQPWDAVFERVDVSRYLDGVYAPLPTHAHIDALEAQLGARLPDSYRAFMTRFGPGLVMDLMRLLPVVPLVSEQPLQTVAERTAQLREFYHHKLPRPTGHERLARLISFATHHDGEYVWDPAEATSETPREYPIYVYYGPSSRHGPDTLWAQYDSFTNCLSEFAADQWARGGNEYYEAGDIPFTPLPVRREKAPTESEVAIWLAANNNTARDLALSIRDRGQTDAFPILADALEEAGCTNADLLDSCRTGDPDIDGQWVLQVLLGKK